MTHYLPMNGFTTRANTNPLLEQVFSILDSRIQFIDYQVQKYFKTCTNTEASTLQDGTAYTGPGISQNIMTNFESMLQFTGQLHGDLKLLQILKAWLKEETVQIILDLLTNNKYLTYSEEKLEHLLKKEVLVFYPKYSALRIRIELVPEPS